MVSKKLIPFLSVAPLPLIPLGDLFRNSEFGFGGIPNILDKGNDVVDKALDGVVEKVKEKFSISEFLGIKDKINDIAEHMHQKALLTPDLSDDKINFLKEMNDYVSNASIINFFPSWIKDIIIYVVALIGGTTHDAIQWVFKTAYKIMSSVVLYTPEWLFQGKWFSESLFQFSAINIGIVILLAMIQGLKRMANLDHSSLTHILKRLPIAIGVSGAAPILFNWAIKVINTVTRWITNLGGKGISSNHLNNVFSSELIFEPINFVMMIFFCLIVAVLCVPMFLSHGRRWFIMITTGLLTPFAMTAYLFKDLEKYFDMWLSTIKELGMKQLTYAFFIMILGLIMFATPNPTNIAGVFAKSLVMLGGMHTITFPPQFIKMAGKEKDMFTMAKELKGKVDPLFDKELINDKKEKAENAAIGTARIAGKAYRFLFKK